MKYFGDFEDKEDVFSNFNVKDEDTKGVEILLASYDNEGYDGSAMVIFEKDDKLFEVHGSHCSCMGLEDQWDPEETTFEALQFRYDQDAPQDHLNESQGDEVTKRVLEIILDNVIEKEVFGEDNEH